MAQPRIELRAGALNVSTAIAVAPLEVSLNNPFLPPITMEQIGHSATLLSVGK